MSFCELNGSTALPARYGCGSNFFGGDSGVTFGLHLAVLLVHPLLQFIICRKPAATRVSAASEASVASARGGRHAGKVVEAHHFFAPGFFAVFFSLAFFIAWSSSASR